MRRFLFIVGIFFSLTLFGQGKGCIPTLPEYPFRDGEQMAFSLMYKWGAVNTEVGQAVVTLDSLQFNGEQAYHMNFKVKSAPFFDIFFKMREDFHSWFTVRELRPLQFSRDTYEGGYTATNFYLYDWPASVIHADMNFNGQGNEHHEIPLHDCLYDLPALIYYLRTMDLSKMQEGGRYYISFAMDDDVTDLVLTYHGPERLKVRRKGWMDGLLFTCTVQKGTMFAGDQELKVWFSADGQFVPLGVMAPLRVGAVWAWIKDYQR